MHGRWRTWARIRPDGLFPTSRGASGLPRGLAATGRAASFQPRSPTHGRLAHPLGTRELQGHQRTARTDDRPSVCPNWLPTHRLKFLGAVRWDPACARHRSCQPPVERHQMRAERLRLGATRSPRARSTAHSPTVGVPRLNGRLGADAHPSGGHPGAGTGDNVVERQEFLRGMLVALRAPSVQVAPSRRRERCADAGFAYVQRILAACCQLADCLRRQTASSNSLAASLSASLR